MKQVQVLLRRLKRRSLVDAAVLVFSFWCAYLLRFDFAIPRSALNSALVVTPFVVALQVVVMRRYGIHRAVGRYVSFDDLASFIWAAIFWLVVMLGVRVLLPQGPWRIPVSVSLMDTVLAVVGVLAVRLGQRFVAESQEAGRTEERTATNPVLLVGAGEAGASVAHELRRHATDLVVRGFVDDDPKKDGAVIAGAQVIGTTADIPRLVDTLGIDQAIVTIADAHPSVMRRIARLCGEAGVRMRTIPSFLDIVQGSVEITAFHDVDIEDLLGRDPVRLDLSVVVAAYLGKRVVMVTGAGGSIGSELARQVADFAPRTLLLVEQFEGGLFGIHRELASQFPNVAVVPLVADITDRARVQGIMDHYAPDVVVHAAAHKHVAMMEENPGEAIKNNTFGTELIAEMSGERGVECFVFVSTDKAVRPTSMMGASKRLGELVVQRCNERYERTRYIAVRFGNVMGSSGSVVPIFKDQVRKGGPVTVTHEDASRYFMTIPEAARLVLTAGALGNGGEIMVLDMGKPVRIIDLARNLIKLSGYDPETDIRIEITGLKRGEKLSEDLYADGEVMELTRHPKIFVGRSGGHERIHATLLRLHEIVDDADEAELRRVVQEAIPESRVLVAETELSTSEGSGAGS